MLPTFPRYYARGEAMGDTFLRGMMVRFGVFVYAGVEPIDLATFGVLSIARRLAP